MQGHWQNMEVKWNHHSPWWLIKYSSFPSFWSPHDRDFSRVIGLFEVVQSLSPVQLFCDSVDCSPSGSSVHGTLQMTIKKCVSKRCGWTLWLPLADGGSWLISRYIAICRGLRGTEPARAEWAGPTLQPLQPHLSQGWRPLSQGASHPDIWVGCPEVGNYWVLHRCLSFAGVCHLYGIDVSMCHKIVKMKSPWNITSAPSLV